MSKPNLLLSVKISFLKIPYVNNSHKENNEFNDNVKKNIVNMMYASITSLNFISEVFFIQILFENALNICIRTKISNTITT